MCWPPFMFCLAFSLSLDVLDIIMMRHLYSPILFLLLSHSSNYSLSSCVTANFHHSSPISPIFTPPSPSSFSDLLCSLVLIIFVLSVFPSFFLDYTKLHLFLSSLHPIFSRPHSHDKFFRSGPCRDWRGGGRYRLHPALPSHCPRQIPHQTQRSTAQTHLCRHTHPCIHT